ncbi:MAG: stage V sporulation protein AD [Bacillus sp. (in: firmicutes)]
MIKAHRSWIFDKNPVIIGTGTVGGPFEANGKLADEFDLLHEDLWIRQDSFEKAHRMLIEEACQQAIQKAGIVKEQVNFFFGGDLINQITPTSFAMRTMGIPYLGLFGACSTSMEGLALSAYLINSGGAEYVMTGASSHNAAVEKQFRYPTDYGAQKPPTSQWTVTGAGVALLAENGEGPRVTSATIGRVVDMGMSDPMNMGGAMAPAAVDTIEAHLLERQVDADYYDLIVTGDLGTIGHRTAVELFKEHNITIKEQNFRDCGMMIYKENQQVMAGASGAGCSATVVYGHILNRLRKKELNRVLVVATGALLSPLSYQQQESIPCIAHAVSIENL